MDPLTYAKLHPDFLWSQLDPRWAYKKLGTTNLTVGRYGCSSLAATYVIDRWRKDHGFRFLYPSQVVDQALYNHDGGIYWNTVDRLTFGHLRHTYDKTKAHYVLVQVEWVKPTKYPYHWIVKCDGDLCYNSLKNGVACIQKLDQPSVWKLTGREIYYEIIP